MPGMGEIALNDCLLHVRRSREWKGKRRRRTIPLLSRWNVPDARDLRPRVTWRETARLTSRLPLRYPSGSTGLSTEVLIYQRFVR